MDVVAYSVCMCVLKWKVPRQGQSSYNLTSVRIAGLTHQHQVENYAGNALLHGITDQW
jgi:hypothetical protein